MSNSEFTAIPMRPCIKCGATERNKNGDCKACARARMATLRAANPVGEKAARSARYAANPGKVKAMGAAWRAANPDKKKATDAAWNAANPEAKRIRVQNRRARKKKAGGKLSSNLSAKLFKLQKGKCPCCNQPLGNDFHLDHIMPLIRGGSNTDDNIQLLRAICNLQKNAAHPVDFMQSRGFLL